MKLVSSALPVSRMRWSIVCALTLAASSTLASCKRSEPPPDLLKTQRDAMERAREVGKTMQKAVDEEGKKADQEGR